jgi:hypothetical protein
MEAESIGWIPLDEGAYLHIGADDVVIQVVGMPVSEAIPSNFLDIYPAINHSK